MDLERKGTVWIDGYPLRYRVEGEGVPVLVVGSSVYYPRLFSEELRKQAKLIFIDHRGHAPSPEGQEALQERDPLNRVLDDIEAIRRQLEIKDFVVAGHSGNAFLALEYAIKYPEYVRKIALLNTATSNSPERQQGSIAFFEETADEARKVKFHADFARLPADIERDPERRFAHMCIRMGAHSFFDYQFDAAPTWDGVYTNMPWIDYLWGEAFAKLHIPDRLTLTEKPVFLALGRYDYLVGPHTLWEGIENEYPKLRKAVFDRSGHSPMLEEAERFDAVFTEWLYS
ncbi:MULTISPECIES: alpha/beta hydrolase [Paenibacillus]|uniref:alpha/beta fold hydrolase n=1 Tax=Paenibacillus TaxID=44249 RepID=UPI002FE11BF2